MVKASVTPALSAQLKANGQSEAALIKAFSNWKQWHPIDQYEFGKDTVGTPLAHVHMVPRDAAARKIWDDCFRNVQTRTSDRYLLYVDGGRKWGYLLIAAIDDPGGHDLWQPQNKGRLQVLEAVASDFKRTGIPPPYP